MAFISVLVLKSLFIFMKCISPNIVFHLYYKLIGHA